MIIVLTRVSPKLPASILYFKKLSVFSYGPHRRSVLGLLDSVSRAYSMGLLSVVRPSENKLNFDTLG